MTEAEIYAELTDIFRDFFADDGLALTPQTVAADVEGWDSLNHLSLMVAVERRFGIKFRNIETENLANVGELAAAVARRVAEAAGGR